MAIANSDGSIILSTKVDTSGMEQGTKSLKSQAAKLAAEYRKAGMSQSEAFKKAWSEIERTRKETEKATKSTQTYGEKAKTAFQGVGSALKSLAGYLALAFSVTKIIQFSNEAGQLATQTEASVQRLVDIYGSASDAVGDFIDANARALGMSKAAAASFSSVYGNLFSVWADQATNAELTNRYLNMTAVVASKTGRTVEDVQERVRSGLLGNTEAIEDLGVFVNVKTIEMTDAFQRMANGRSWEQLDAYTQQQIRSMAILEQATAKYGDEVADTSATIRNRFNAAYEDFKNTWGQFINTVLLPILEVLTQVFDIATKGMNALMGKSGKTLENVELQEENTNKTAKNIEEQTDNQKALNKEMKKTLAAFDDLNILSSGESGGVENETTTPSVNVGGIGVGGMEEAEHPSDDGLSGMVQEIKANLDYLLPTISLGLVAIGLILLAMGNIPWGIGFIIGGAYLYSVTEGSEGAFDFQAIKDDLQTLVDNIEEILIGIGIILLFLGQIGWGIGFIIAGAVIYAVKELQSEEYDTADISTKLAVIMEAVSLALVGIGVMLIFFGHVALGLGFIFVGKKLLDVQEQRLSEGGVTTKLQQFMTDNSGLIVGVGLALVVIGLICFCFGLFTPLTFGIFMAGAAVLATEETMNPGAIKEEITNFFQDNKGLIVGVSIALVVLGIILLFTGVGIPLAIGLIVAGGGALATEVALNWDFIVDKVEDVWDKVKEFWNKNIAPIFTVKWWANLGKNIINGLISGIETGINWIIDALNWFIGGLSSITETVGDVIGQDWEIPEIGHIQIPRLAKGAVIPPNREFLAVLGDNKKENEIVSPVSTMKQAFMEAMVEMGSTGQTVKEEHYYLSETELMTILHKLVKGGERLQGSSLISVGGY